MREVIDYYLGRRRAPKLSGAVLVGHFFGVVTCDDFDLVGSEGRGWSRWVLMTRGRLGASTVLGIRGNHVMSDRKSVVEGKISRV